MSVKITPNELVTSAQKYRSDLLKVVVMALGPALSYMTVRSGIRYGETVGELSGEIEAGPYDSSRVDTSGVGINGRTLYTFLGSAIKEFDPNSVVQSIYGSSITKGTQLQNTNIALQVLSFLSAKLGKGFAMHLFDAVRNDKGTKTVDLFNGLDTIAAAEIEAGNISVANKNLYEFEEVIDSTNAVDLITDFCRSALDELLGQEDGGDPDERGSGLNLLVPRRLIYAYRDDYKSTTGHSPIYDKFNQTVVEGFGNIKLVPFAGKTNSDLIQLTTKNNTLIGTDQMGDVEKLMIWQKEALSLQFVATMFFGTQWESISPERLLVGKLKTSTKDDTPVKDGDNDDNDDNNDNNNEPSQS